MKHAEQSWRGYADKQTPNTIIVTMILEDLDNGIDRPGIQEKYGLEKWEVTQMFQHPSLKGKKAKKVRKLSFNFVDDTATDPNQTSIPMESVGPDVDVHTEASMIVEATPELQDPVMHLMMKMNFNY